jgi:hypothetical protein
VFDLEQQTGAGVVDEGEHLGEAGHSDPGELRTFPPTGVEGGDLGGVHSGDGSVGAVGVERAGVRGAVDGGVVHDDELAVGAHVHVGLDHVRALVDAGHERGDRVLRPFCGGASVRDDQGRDAGEVGTAAVGGTSASGTDEIVSGPGTDPGARPRVGCGGHEGDGHVSTPPWGLRIGGRAAAWLTDYRVRWRPD